MKILPILILSFSVYHSLRPIKISYVFRDACTDSLYMASYGLDQPSNSGSYSSKGRELILDSPGVYIFGTVIWRNGENLLFGTDKVYKKGETYTDAIFIPKFLPRQNALHDNAIAFYTCGKKASGVVKDYYPNGMIRMEGTFLDGIPTSDIKYYNIKGRFVKKQIYRSGHYIDTKFYHDRDKTDYY